VILGFTGTRRGMTVAQKQAFVQALSRFPVPPHEFHHGDCRGADAEAFALLERALGKRCETFAHPSILLSDRAYTNSDNIYSPRPPLERNEIIIRICDILVAAPGEVNELLRSGTWSTVRYARKRARYTILIYPNGETLEEHKP